MNKTLKKNKAQHLHFCNLFSDIIKQKNIFQSEKNNCDLIKCTSTKCVEAVHFALWSEDINQKYVIHLQDKALRWDV